MYCNIYETTLLRVRSVQRPFVPPSSPPGSCPAFCLNYKRVNIFPNLRNRKVLQLHIILNLLVNLLFPENSVALEVYEKWTVALTETFQMHFERLAFANRVNLYSYGILFIYLHSVLKSVVWTRQSEQVFIRESVVGCVCTIW